MIDGKHSDAPEQMCDVKIQWPTQKRSYAAFRWVQWCTLAALVWKLGPFIEIARCYYSTPLNQAFFPVPLRSPTVLAVCYISTLLALVTTIFTMVPRRRIGASLIAWLCLTVLCVHQGSHNDMTFATSWWTSLWSLWLATQLAKKEDDSSLLIRAAFLSRCIASMILLGGAVGKWTSEYWSGQVLYEIYFRDRDFWVFNILRGALEPDSLFVAAKWYSRHVIIIESLCGFGLWLLPARLAAMIGVVVFVSIATFSNFNLFSVLLSVIGLASTGLFIRHVDAKSVETTT